MAAYNSWEYYVFDMDPEDAIILFKRPSDGIVVYTGPSTRRKRPERKIKVTP